MLLELNHKWDVDVNTYCCSENIEIIFSALHSTVCDFADKALIWQGHKVIFMQWVNLDSHQALEVLLGTFFVYIFKMHCWTSSP